MVSGQYYTYCYPDAQAHGFQSGGDSLSMPRRLAVPGTPPLSPMMSPALTTSPFFTISFDKWAYRHAYPSACLTMQYPPYVLLSCCRLYNFTIFYARNRSSRYNDPIHPDMPMPPEWSVYGSHFIYGIDDECWFTLQLCEGSLHNHRYRMGI